MTTSRRTTVAGGEQANTAPPAEKKGAAKHGEDDAYVPTDEFGGPIGNLGFIVFSHFIMYYLWMCVQFNDGLLLYPKSVDEVVPFFHGFFDKIATHAAPTPYAAALYLGFLGFQTVLALIMPGFETRGLPVPSEGGKALLYYCNGVSSWYCSIIVFAFLQLSGYFSLSAVIDHLGPLMTFAMIFSDFVAVTAYLSAIFLGKAHRMSGNVIYDFFMGAWLNPRIGNFDIKFFAETRFPWIGLFFLTVSCAVKQYEEHGQVCFSMWFIILAHFLYTNAVMKGEELIPPTWDIFYEKWGFMLIFWNLAGVPFVYSTTSFYIQKAGIIEVPTWAKVALLTFFLTMYWIWDTANSQKTRFRQQMNGTFKPRKTFPQLPWGTLSMPIKHIVTANGSTLLTDGWYQFARKIHYTSDNSMAWCWGLCAGFGSVLPYFYATFFFCVLVHRYLRDDHRCAIKYGKDWDRYREIVPYVFIPYVY